MHLILSVFFLIIFAISIYKKLNVTPVSSLCVSLFTGITFLYLSASIRLLFLGSVFFFSVCFFSFIYTLYKKEEIRSFFSSEIKLILLTSLAFIVIYSIQKPITFYWDEYSFWSTAAKLVKESNKLYIYTPDLLGTLNGIPPFTSLLSYLIQFFSPNYNDYSLIFSYTFVYICAFGLISEFIRIKSGKTFLSALAFIALVFSPLLQNYHPYKVTYLAISYGYTTTMADFLLGIVFTILVFLFLSNTEKPIYFLGILPLIFTKDIGIFFVILAIAIISVFQLFNKKQKICTKLIFIFLGLAVMSITFTSWITLKQNQHMHYEYHNTSIKKADLEFYKNDLFSTLEDEEIVVEKQPTEEIIPGSGKIVNFLPPHPILDQIEVLANYFFNPSTRNSLQVSIIDNIKNQFFTSKTIFGVKDSVLVSILIVLSILIVIMVPKKYKLSLSIVLLGITFSLYVYMISLSYFIAGFNDGLVEYGRYITSFYWFWIYFVFSIFIVLIAKNKYISAMALSFLICYGAYYTYSMGLNYTVISAPDNLYVPYSNRISYIEKYDEYLVDGAKVLLIYEKEPAILPVIDAKTFFPARINLANPKSEFDFSIGFSNKEFVTKATANTFNIASDEEFLNVFKENFDYLYILYYQEEFVDSYSDLFAQEPKVNTMYKLVGDNNLKFMEVNV